MLSDCTGLPDSGTVTESSFSWQHGYLCSSRRTSLLFKEHRTAPADNQRPAWGVCISQQHSHSRAWRTTCQGQRMTVSQQAMPTSPRSTAQPSAYSRKTTPRNARKLRISGGLEKRGAHPNLQVWRVKPGGENAPGSVSSPAESKQKAHKCST